MRSLSALFYLNSSIVILEIFILISPLNLTAQDEDLPMIQGLPDQDDSKEFSTEESATVQTPLVEGFFYDPSGKRDPFSPPENLVPKEQKSTDQRQGPPSLEASREQPINSVPLSQLRLIGIMWSPDDPYAMFQLPDSRVVIIRPRNKIGLELALVASIKEGEVLVILPDAEGNYEQGKVESIKLQR